MVVWSVVAGRKFASLAPVRLACAVRSVPLKMASLQRAPTSWAPGISAPLKSVCSMFARERSARVATAIVNAACERSASVAVAHSRCASPRADAAEAKPAQVGAAQVGARKVDRAQLGVLGRLDTAKDREGRSDVGRRRRPRLAVTGWVGPLGVRAGVGGEGLADLVGELEVGIGGQPAEGVGAARGGRLPVGGRRG